MSKKFLAGALIFSACSALSTVAQADNTITFNGIVSDTTCTATIDGGVTAIDMGTTSVADLKAYTFGAAKNFSFSLADWQQYRPRHFWRCFRYCEQRLF